MGVCFLFVFCFRSGTLNSNVIIWGVEGFAFEFHIQLPFIESFKTNSEGDICAWSIFLQVLQRLAKNSKACLIIVLPLRKCIICNFMHEHFLIFQRLFVRL